MKIKLLSDLHLEFYKNPEKVIEGLFTPNVDVLVLAGDVAVGLKNVETALWQFAAQYNQVIYVPGNHEYYNTNLNILDMISLPKNVRMLNPNSVKIGDITFIGASLWTNFNNNPLAQETARSFINDFRVIKDFTPYKCKELFNYHSSYIKQAYEAIPGKKIIVTHFLPAVACISPRFRNEGLLNYYFANNMDGWIDSLNNVPYWFFGHTHDQVDVTIGETRLIANPYGYPRENTSLSKEIYEV